LQALLRQLDFHGAALAAVDRELAAEALADPVVARLMTIPGVDAITAISIVAAVGDFSRFGDASKLVAYVGLNPKVRQSGNSPPVHGRISKAGRAQVRGMLVEAAWSASHAPGPLRAFYQRIKARRGFQTAVVATACKMTVLAWHLVTKDQDYAFARPALVATSGASSSSPPERPHSAATTASPTRPTTTGNDATKRPPRPPSEPNAPTKSSSPTGRPENHPAPAASLDNIIRGADDGADLPVEGQERHEFGPGVLPQPDDRGRGRFAREVRRAPGNSLCA
jgi:hypothetical protein